MKHLLHLCAIIVTVTAQSKLKEIFREGVAGLGPECMKEVSASNDDLNGISDLLIPTSREGMCLITCIHKRFGIQMDNGNVDKEGTATFTAPLKDLDPDYFKENKQIFDECVNSVADDADGCVTGTNMMKCIVDTGRNNGVFS